MARMRDGLVLAVGTLTRLPVPAPRSVDRRTAGIAMSVAPVIGAGLGAVCALPLLIPATGTTRLLTALLAVTLLAWCTRALHLDGLADTMDALGSGKPAAQALEIARKSDIGPFGVIGIVLVIGIDATALSTLSYWAAVLAIAISRTALVIGTCAAPAARADGLGAAVARSVPVLVAAAWIVVIITVCTMTLSAPGAVAAVAGLLAAIITLLVARRRLGGITGDVLGAMTEIALAAALVALALTA